MKLKYRSYKYFLYEKHLANLEIQRFLKTNVLSNDHSHLEIDIKGNIDKLKRLTYFESYNDGNSEILTTQYMLENSDSTKKHKQATRYSVHGIHEYKGKFNPQIVKAILNILNIKKGDIVLDPFCGSGTTLVEAEHLDCIGIGIDINPMAVFISNSKIDSLSCEHTLMISIFEKTDALFHSLITENHIQETPRTKYLSTWFDLSILNQIECLRKCIINCSCGHHNIFLVLASNILRDYSLQDPLDLRIRRRSSPLPEKPLFEAFRNQFNQFMERVIATQKIIGIRKNKSRANKIDVRSNIDLNLLLKKTPVAAIITSPPYVTALPYIDTQRLSLVWLDLIPPEKILSLESELIGSREFHNKQKTVLLDEIKTNTRKIPIEQFNFCQFIQNSIGTKDGFRRKALPILIYRYFADMQQMFLNIRKCVTPGTPYALVIGRNHTVLDGQRIEINTTAHIKNLAENCKWVTKEIINLQTYQRFGYNQDNAVSKEDLLILEAI